MKGKRENLLFVAVTLLILSFIAYDASARVSVTNEFVWPTPQDGSTIPRDHIYANLTTTATNEYYSLVDFDQSLVGWYRFEETWRWCYQEHANISTQCGGLDSGAYECVGDTWENCGLTYDGDWFTSSEDNTKFGGNANLFINYSKPSNAINSSIWNVKDMSGSRNLTIHSDCWNQEPLQLRVTNNWESDMTNNYYCWGGSEWVSLYVADSSGGFYEEAMWWRFKTPEMVANDYESGWSYEGNCTNPERLVDEDWDTYGSVLNTEPGVNS
ncbi:MAG: hypothetical protein DRO99_05135, partial [Candidatus Aenigmatarchaeota archaeon]